MPYDKYDQSPLIELWANQIEEMLKANAPKPILPQMGHKEPKQEPVVLEHGKIYTTSSGGVYRWVTNHPDHPQGAWCKPEREWESGAYQDV